MPVLSVCLSVCFVCPISYLNKKLSYRRGTARRTMSLEILSSAAQLHENTLKRLTIGEWPWRSLRTGPNKRRLVHQVAAPGTKCAVSSCILFCWFSSVFCLFKCLNFVINFTFKELRTRCFRNKSKEAMQAVCMVVCVGVQDVSSAKFHSSTSASWCQ